VIVHRFQIKPGSTSNVLLFNIGSTVANGAQTGLAYNTSGLTVYYKRSSGTASVQVTLVDITTLGTFVSGGFKVVDGTGMPGTYEFHPPNAAFNTGADWVVFELKTPNGDAIIFCDLGRGAEAVLSKQLGLESVPAIGTLPTLEQAIFMLLGAALNVSYSGTTLTLYKQDGVTPLLTCQLDSSTAPTSRIRNT